MPALIFIERQATTTSPIVNCEMSNELEAAQYQTAGEEVNETRVDHAVSTHAYLPGNGKVSIPFVRRVLENGQERTLQRKVCQRVRSNQSEGHTQEVRKHLSVHFGWTLRCNWPKLAMSNASARP